MVENQENYRKLRMFPFVKQNNEEGVNKEQLITRDQVTTSIGYSDSFLLLLITLVYYSKVLGFL